MKKVLAALLITTIMLVPVTSCNKKGSGAFVKADVESEKPPKETEVVYSSEETSPPVDPTEIPDVQEREAISVWGYADDTRLIVDKFLELHPDFDYDIYVTQIATDNGGYRMALDSALVEGDVDVYFVESSFASKYTQGSMSSYACPYEDLGIDVNSGVAMADIAQYSVEVGTRPSDGKIVALSYESAAGVMIYRASIAEDTWGTSDPEEIKEIVGGGSGNWDKFWVAAEDLKTKGYSIVSSDGDMWRPVENSASYGWVVDGDLYIDPAREEFLDISLKLMENDYHNDTMDWYDMWYADMNGTGDREVFAFFGPSWFINYVLGGYGYDTAGDWRVTESPEGFFWGGNWVVTSQYAAQASDEKKAAIAEFIEWITLDYSETGLQYLWANGEMRYPEFRIPVVSGKVLEMSDGSCDYLGGQNMYEYFIPANSSASGTVLSEYDETINNIWRDQVRQYTAGEKTREEAITDFKITVAEDLGIVE